MVGYRGSWGRIARQMKCRFCALVNNSPLVVQHGHVLKFGFGAFQSPQRATQYFRHFLGSGELELLFSRKVVASSVRKSRC